MNNKNGDYMKKRTLFLNRIILNKTYSLKIDESHEYLNIYKNEVLIEKFLLRRRIYTFFKLLQSIIQDDEVIIDNNKNTALYGAEIKINDNLYMRLTTHREELTVEFYN